MDLLVQSWFHAGWPHPQLQTIAHPSAHPDSAFGSALFKKCVCCAGYGIFPPHRKASNMCKSRSVRAVGLSERPAWQLWCDSHRTGKGTTRTPGDKQMVRGKIPATALADDCLSWRQFEELRVDAVGHSAGGWPSRPARNSFHRWTVHEN